MRALLACRRESPTPACESCGHQPWSWAPPLLRACELGGACSNITLDGGTPLSLPQLPQLRPSLHWQ